MIFYNCLVMITVYSILKVCVIIRLSECLFCDFVNNEHDECNDWVDKFEVVM